MKTVTQATLYLVLLLAAGGCRKESSVTVVDDNAASETSTTSSASTSEITTSVEPPLASQPPAGDSTPDSSAAPLPNRHKVEPVDDASSDPSFAAFRETLRDIVQRKDSKAFLAIVDPKIRASFGDANGIEAFRKSWKLDQPGSKLWEELGEVLRLGGSWTPGPPKVFWAPYTFSNFPQDGPDAFSTLIVLDRDVPLKEAPSASSKTLGTLSHDIVTIARGDRHDGDWRKVTTSGGTTGYLPGSKVRSHIDYRAGFEKKEGKWLMTIFVAGD